MKKKIVAIVLSLFMVTGVAGCGDKVPAGTIATVNNVPILQEELDINYEQFLQMYAAYGMDTSDETLQLNLRNSILESLIVQEVLVQEATKRELPVTDADVDAYVQGVKDTYYEGDEAAYAAALENAGYTVESYAEAVREQLLLEALRDELVSHPEVVDVAKARHIVVATEIEALDLIGQLDAGADFGILAKEYSTDAGSAVDGGNLGYFALNGDTTSKMVEEFASAVRAQELGIHSSAPVKSQFGYHIILVEDRALEVDLLSNPEKYVEVLQGIYNNGLDNLAATLLQTVEVEILIDTTTL